MANVTTFGKVLRKLRIDHSEILGDMAKKLKISPAYLSAIENNGRVIPDDLIAKLFGFPSFGIETDPGLTMIESLSFFSARRT